MVVTMVSSNEDAAYRNSLGNYFRWAVLLILIPTLVKTVVGTPSEHGADVKMHNIPLGTHFQLPPQPQEANGTETNTIDFPDETPHKDLPENVRRKRMLYGSHFDNTRSSALTYGVIKWFVSISNSHACTYRQDERYYEVFRITIHLNKFRTLGCVMPYGYPVCGGSVISPFVVQTACHCLASFWEDSSDRGASRNPQVKSVWEDHSLVFRPGGTDLVTPFIHAEYWKQYGTKYDRLPSLVYAAREDFLYAKKYYVHGRCQRIKQRIFSYDFGLIILSRVVLDVPLYISTFLDHVVEVPTFDQKKYIAPLLTEQSLTEEWGRVQRHQSTCLVIGVGWENFAGGVYLEALPPNMMKYSWRAVASRVWCSKYLHRFSNLNTTDLAFWRDKYDCEEGYNDCCTWDCTVRVGKLNSVPSFGDDGGPVVCNGFLYGLLGPFHPPPERWEVPVILVHDIVYNRDNYAEYSQFLIDLEWRYKDTVQPEEIPKRRTTKKKSSYVKKFSSDSERPDMSAGPKVNSNARDTTRRSSFSSLLIFTTNLVVLIYLNL